MRFPEMDHLPPLESDPVVEAYKRGVDRSLLRENLKRTPEERILVLQRFLEAAEELQRAMRQSRAQS